MSRRSAGRAPLVLLGLSLLAAPAFAGGPRADRSASPAVDLSPVFVRLWTAVVQHLPFGNAAADIAATPDTPADHSEADRSASLDPWG